MSKFNKKGNLEYSFDQKTFHFNDRSKELSPKGWIIIAENIDHDIALKFFREADKPRSIFSFTGTENECVRKLKKSFELFRKAYLYDQIAKKLK